MRRFRQRVATALTTFKLAAAAAATTTAVSASSSSSSSSSYSYSTNKSKPRPEYITGGLKVVSVYGCGTDPTAKEYTCPEEDFVFDEEQEEQGKEENGREGVSNQQDIIGELELTATERATTTTAMARTTDDGRSSACSTTDEEEGKALLRQSESSLRVVDSLLFGASSSSLSTPIHQQEAVILHEKVIPDGAELSRLHQLVHVKETKDGSPPDTRSNSRAAQFRSINTQELELFQLEKKLEEEFGYVSMPDPLPLESPNMAEQVLEMEVSGMIDETWQDARKARVEDVSEICEVLKQMKTRDIVAIDVSAKCSAFDFMVYTTAENQRHIHLAAWAVQEADKFCRVTKIPRQRTSNQWECVPIGRIIVNIMTEEFRSGISMERKWTVTSEMDPVKLASSSAVSEGRNAKAHGLWSLTLNLQDLEDYEIDYCKEALLQQV